MKGKKDDEDEDEDDDDDDDLSKNRTVCDNTVGHRLL